MKIRKMISVLSASALMMTALTSAAWGGESAQAEYAMPGVVPEEDSPEPGEEVSLSMEVFPCYLEDMEYSLDLPVYFLDDVTDLPYVNLADWADVMVSVYSLYGEDDYELELETDGPVAQYTRESGYAMLFDFNEGTIAFDDYDNFVHDPQFTSLLDMVSMDLYNEEGEPLVLERIERGSFDRYGREIELNLTDYNIPIVWSEEDDLYLVPLQTMADFLLAGPTLLNSYFNGEAVYLATKDDFGVESTEFTPLGVSYYSAPYGEMSETLAWFNYCELCLALDHLYGLKEIHDITTFDNIFYETGYREDLRSTDPNIADGALYDFIYYYLDDLHSGFTFASYRTEELYTIGGTGLSSQQDSINEQIFSQARENTDREITAYQEIGNTAYITFDGFQILNDPEEYYKSGVSPMENVDPLSPDTIELILYAHERITRQDSPIENVVIDMSLNGGGALDACAFVAAWFLGEASTSIRSSLTGAVSTGKYRVDANLDDVFDENDSVADRNLYCLIGPYSFSCGNLLPNIFKSSNRVTLLGQTSGGGSCSVLPMSTANGAMFQVSSPYRMSYLKNGSYYDIDLGVDPDYNISRPSNFYDREALTDYINQLF